MKLLAAADCCGVAVVYETVAGVGFLFPRRVESRGGEENHSAGRRPVAPFPLLRRSSVSIQPTAFRIRGSFCILISFLKEFSRYLVSALFFRSVSIFQ
jgi:hypothetical protein